MKISLDWLSDFIDISDIAPEVIADRLTMATAEVEGLEAIERSVEGIVVAEVLSIEPIEARGDDESRLVWATVDTGKGKRLTVCGARNVRQGIKAPFAAAGSRLADGSEISISEIAGRKSEGVLCSPQELGFSAFHEGVLECPSALQNGASLSSYVKARDILLEVDNKSLTNRPDLWGHYGFARELAAIFGKPLRELKQVELSRFDSLPSFPVAIEDEDLCPCYACIEFEVEAMAPSPLQIQARLHALGQRSFGLMIDLSNYVMLETAQPTHAFDANLVSAIRVAASGEDSVFQTLDGVERKLLQSDLMIWNERHPVALAGIMGGRDSEVRASTSRVLLESANFKGSQVRRTSTRLGLRTDASQRFEKNQPPVNTRTAIGRILQLIEESAVSYRPVTRFSLAGQLQDSFRPLRLPLSGVKRAAGFPIDDQRIVSILRSLEFEVEVDAGGDLRLGVPPFRSKQDISIAPDIIEEVLRVYGYDEVPPELPSAYLQPVYIDNLLRREHKTQRALSQGHGFMEVHTYIWMDDFWLEKIGFQPSKTLIVKNPSAEGKRQLRTTLLPNLLALIDQNRNQRQKFKIFEVGHVFQTTDGEADQQRTHVDGVSERTHLAGLSFVSSSEGDIEAHYLSIKGAVEDVASVIGCGELLFKKRKYAAIAPWAVDGKYVSVELNGEKIGEMGILSGPVLQACAPGGQVVWFELSLEGMPGPTFAEATYQPPPVYPASWQDFSLVWSIKKGYAELRETLDAFAHPLIKGLEFRGFYKDNEASSDDGSYTFRYLLGAPDRTLTGEDLEEFRAELLAHLAQRGISLK
jgi:phenylalanyl-tRNA synthetase beta chain